jgi:RNA methyltransferase, TrmH family
MRRITSRQNPVVARSRAAARGELDGVLLLDGAHLVSEALAAGVHLREAIVDGGSTARAEIAALIEQLSRAGVDVAAAPAAVMHAISPVRSPSAVVALGDRPAPRERDLFAGGPGPPLVVVAVDVQDPGNLGAIVRVAEAARASGVVAAGASADPFGWKALRGSMGSALRLPIGVGDASQAIAEARRRGCRIVAAAPRGGRSVFDVDLTGPTAMAIGGEGRGLPDPILADADERVTIPMQAPVESLNAAVTAAVILYEAYRQRSVRLKPDTTYNASGRT